MSKSYCGCSFFVDDLVMVIIINIFVSLLFLSGLNCQLGYTWLVHQQIQCAENTRNVHEAAKHQYICTFSRTWTCVVDANTYSHRHLYLDHFCGFINSNYVAQNEVTWNINVKPNIHIYFQNFSLSTNYWYCDFEYLQVITSDINSIFCGTRLPWVHDVTGSSVKIIFFTKRFGSEKYQLQFQYYGAHVSNYQHFVLFTESSAMSGMHVPNTKENEFETFHFMSNNRLDILYLAAVNVCSMQQVVCYDGPGTKSPILQCRHWACQSSTFQMVCRFSKSKSDCSKAPSLHYHAMKANITYFDKKEVGCSGTEMRIDCLHIKTIKNKKIVAGRGTSKFIYLASTITPEGVEKGGIALDIKKMDISFPYMLYEEKSCMYGGVYIIDTSSSEHGHEILSLCDSRTQFLFNLPTWRVSIVIIHYEKYSAAGINFEADIVFPYVQDFVLPKDVITVQGETMTVNLTSDMLSIKHHHLPPTYFYLDRMVYINSYLIDIRKIQYIQINLEIIAGVVVQEVEFSVHVPDNAESCVYCTVFYAAQFSNFKTRKYDWEMFSKDFRVSEHFQSTVINMSECGMFTFSIWSFRIGNQPEPYRLYGYNKTFYQILNPLYLEIPLMTHIYSLGPLWWKVHLMRPANVLHDAIWKVQFYMIDAMSYVCMEVLTDSHLSSSVYKWDHYNYTDAYMIINGGVNFFFSYADSSEIHEFQTLVQLFFERHMIYGLKKSISGTITILDKYTFHNRR